MQQDSEVQKLNDDLSRLLRGAVFPTVRDDARFPRLHAAVPGASVSTILARVGFCVHIFRQSGPDRRADVKQTLGPGACR